MDKCARSKRVIIKYALIQIPGVVAVVIILILARKWWVLPPWLTWAIIVGWIVKDAILYPFVWRSYDTPRTGEPHSMIGVRGVAEERLEPDGYIRVRGELWRAEVMRDSPIIEKGQAVRVKEMKGLTLIVAADSEKAR